MKAPGKRATPLDMITEQRATEAARSLFCDEAYTGPCDDDTEAVPCAICAYRRDEWQRRIAEVRAAMLQAFA
jgi:hypothetical protein